MNSICIRITKHVIARFKERTQATKTDAAIVRTLESMLDRAKTIEPDPEYKVKSLMKHGFRSTSYFEVDGWIFIVVNDALTTIFTKPKDKKSWWNG